MATKIKVSMPNEKEDCKANAAAMATVMEVLQPLTANARRRILNAALIFFSKQDEVEDE